MSYWSLWVNLWPKLLIANLVSGLYNLAWFFTTLRPKAKKQTGTIYGLSILMSFLACLTVFLLFPTA